MHSFRTTAATVMNTMLTSKRLTSPFFTSIFLCIGVFGVLQLFVLEGGVTGLASRAVWNTRFSDSYDLLFNHRFFSIGMNQMFGSGGDRPNVTKSADSPAQPPSRLVLTPNITPGDQNITNLIKEDIAAIKSADSPAQPPSRLVLTPNIAPGDQNITNLIREDIAPTHMLESGSVSDHKLMTNSSNLVSDKSYKNDLLKSMPGGIFLPVKNLSLPAHTTTDTNWFMSGLRGKPEPGYPEAFDLPRDDPYNRILCVRGNDIHDGTKNGYGLFDATKLPPNSILLNGTTFVNENYWDYRNLWHGMGAVVNLCMWRMRHECIKLDRMLLYHWGEVRNQSDTAKWLNRLLHALVGMEMTVLEPPPSTFQGPGFQDGSQNQTVRDSSASVCFERAVIHRRGLAGMDDKVRRELFDTIRCKVRKFCGINSFERRKGGDLQSSSPPVHMALLTRTGDRAFQNTTAVVEVVQGECDKVDSCQLEVVNFDGYSFCEQVALLSNTDIVVSVHGAQMTNIIFMTPGSRVMELLPKGWLRYAGVGQKAFEWISNWVGLVHEGNWEDPEGPQCPFHDNFRCFLLFKNREVGLNATHLAMWTRDVLRRSVDVKRQKEDILRHQINANQTQQQYCACGADTASYKDPKEKLGLTLRPFFN